MSWCASTTHFVWAIVGPQAELESLYNSLQSVYGLTCIMARRSARGE